MHRKIQDSRQDLIHDKKLLVVYLNADDSVVLKRLAERGLPQEEIDRRMREDQNFWEKYKDSYDFVIENVPGKLDETIDKISRILT